MEKVSNEVKKMYDKSLDDYKKGWRLLCEAVELVGWKELYFMILRLQKETNQFKSYRLQKNPDV